MLFVCYPKCSTCQKAKAWLQERGVAFDERDIKQDNPTEQELRAWHERAVCRLSGSLIRAACSIRRWGSRTSCRP